MLWLIGLLLAAAWGILWWRFGTAGGAAAQVAPPLLAGNHPSLATRHYRLADFRPVPAELVPPTQGPPTEQAAPESAAAGSSPVPPAAESAEVSAAGELPAGTAHNYLTAPAPTANDEHNRGVEMTAAQRRTKMRELLNQAVENRQSPA